MVVKKKRSLAAGLLLLLLLIAVIVVGVVVWSALRGGGSTKTTYANGDFLTTPSEKDLVFDAELGITYCDNLVNVYLTENLDDAGVQALAERYGGTVAGHIAGIVNFMQLEIDPTDYQSILDLADQLMEDEQVLLAFGEIPAEPSEEIAGSDPWSEEDAADDRGNETSPGGNDWWAEAIGAYTAWQYDDLSQSVKIGVLDDGARWGYADMDESRYQALSEDYAITEQGHGTAVVKVIGAENNDVGIRGVFDQAEICFAGYIQYKEQDESGIFSRAVNFVSNLIHGQDTYNLVYNGTYIEILKQMLENGVKVINNSWGNNNMVTSQEELDAFLDSLNDSARAKRASDLETYQEGEEERNRVWALNCMGLLMDLLHDEWGDGTTSDFVIVQSAGNGSYQGNPIDAVSNGAFCTITEELYDEFFLDEKDTLSQHGASFEDVMAHVAIVGGVDHPEDGQYALYSGFNYGDQVTICAPSIDIYFGDIGEKSHVAQNSGTSLASPMVTASIGYLMSLDDTLTAPEALQRLLDTAGEAKSSADADTRESYPMLNVGNAAAMTADRAENNGGRVVGYRGYIYYWKLNSEAMSQTGSSAFTYSQDVKSQLIQRDLQGNEQVILEDVCTGPIYIAKQTLYYERAYSSWGSLSLDSGENQVMDHTQILGVDEDTGSLVCVDAQTANWTVYVKTADGETTALGITSDDVLGVRDGVLYYRTDGTSEIEINSLTFSSMEFGKLSGISKSALASDYNCQYTVLGETGIIMNIGVMQGTGHFFSDGTICYIPYNGDDARILVSGTGNGSADFCPIGYAVVNGEELVYYYADGPISMVGESYLYTFIDDISQVTVSTGKVEKTDFKLDWNGCVTDGGELLVRSYGSREYRTVLTDEMLQTVGSYPALGTSQTGSVTRYLCPYSIDHVAGADYVTLLTETSDLARSGMWLVMDRGDCCMVKVEHQNIELMFTF
jgi:hypothetical protein